MRFAREIADWAAQIVILLFATSTLAMPYVIPSGSMESTLMTGDHVIVDKLAYAPGGGGMMEKLLPYSDVKRGDIIVFRYPPDIRQTFVKRVIGAPGDRIHLENGVVVRNGVRLVEPYVQHVFLDHGETDAFRDNYPNVPGQEILVPEGKYFVMGDNRDNSSDSRYWGFVPRENITGKPIVVFWSYDAPEEDLVEYNMHHMVDVAEHFFTKTRWNRMFKLIRPE
jgi:signal peptidase I